jgi:streptomycin 6-kinase
MSLMIPERLARNCAKTAEWQAWLERLPDAVRELEHRWRLTLEPPFDSAETNCAWVAPAAGTDGVAAVLKLAVPHNEGMQEIPGLRFWDGNPTVRLIEADEVLGAMLLERCEPGIALRTQPEPEQDQVLAGLLRRLWRSPSQPHPFRPLSDLMASWAMETLADAEHWPDAGIAREGLRLFDELPTTAPEEALLATDLHAGNVLMAQREPWLVIDPKPFVGDRAYDATQHLFNCVARLRADPDRTVRRFSDLLEVDHERVRLWTFARAAAGPRDDWMDDDWWLLARALAP